MSGGGRGGGWWRDADDDELERGVENLRDKKERSLWRKKEDENSGQN